ncbi:MAG: hypothetical protein ACRDS9_09615 [Pseudonocardiaceae bacterium]
MCGPADELVQGTLALAVGAGAGAMPEVVEDLTVGHTFDLA